MSDPLWKQLELLVAEIQKDLAPDAHVQHNAMVQGRDSGAMRQVDVLVRQRVGQYEIVVAIDCKDYAVPVDVKGIEEFQGLARDIGAHKAAMVCPKGFTATAKQLAARHQIDLFSPVDTEPHKWQTKLMLPMVCDFRGAAIALGLRFSAPLPFMMPMNFWEGVAVYDATGKLLGTPLKTALERWNDGAYPIEAGEHGNVPMFASEVTIVDNGYGMRVPVELYVSLRVTQRLFFGYLPIEKMRGLRNEQTGAVVTNAFTTGVLDADHVEAEWKNLAHIDEAPVMPALKLLGLDCYEVTV